MKKRGLKGRIGWVNPFSGLYLVQLIQGRIESLDPVKIGFVKGKDTGLKRVIQWYR